MKKRLQKILESIKKDIKYNYKLYIIFLCIVPWFFIEFNYYIFTPGGLIDIKSRVTIDSSYKEEGSFNMTYVAAKKGIAPLILLSYIIPNWDLVSIDDSRIENESTEEIEKRNKLSLKETSYDAIIAAFKEANLPYEIVETNLTIAYIYDEAETSLKQDDIIKSINNIVITDYNSIINEISKYDIGDKITLNVMRDNKIIECYAVLKEINDKKAIGISIMELKDVETTPKVEYIFKNSESGASRGLMCALEIYNRITEYDLTNGDIISGTGTIDENGVVGAIDGVKYKLIGAVKKHAKVFIVPQDNYEEAIKLKKEKNYDIEIIKADNLHNVIEVLKLR